MQVPDPVTQICKFDPGTPPSLCAAASDPPALVDETVRGAQPLLRVRADREPPHGGEQGGLNRCSRVKRRSLFKGNKINLPCTSCCPRIDEELLGDGHSYSPKAIHSWLTRVMYNRRSKMNPLWNTVVIGGFYNGESFLGYVDKLGVAYEAPTVATGFGAYLAQVSRTSYSFLHWCLRAAPPAARMFIRGPS
nr:PREDICTED: proteasome subunit beta type-4 [Lepisosteus oculatus]